MALAAAGVLVAGLVVPAGPAAAAVDELDLVSRASGVAGVVGDSGSSSASISADGRYVAFTSDADNLDPDSNDNLNPVFVRDLQAQTTTLVSRASSAGGVAGVVGDGGSSSASISADGRYVAFHSSADNLDPDSNDDVRDVFVRDLQAQTTTLVSRASSAGGVAGAVGDGSSFSPSISADGRYVAFHSSADNLDPDSNDNVDDVFRRDVLGPPDPGPGLTCAGRAATMVGTPGNDVLIGTPGADVIVALGGNDLIRGRGGNDVICAGSGHDQVRANAGNDIVLGGGGNDTVRGGSGHDDLRGNRGRDLLIGRAGRDLLQGGGGADDLRGNRGNDDLRGKAGNDVLRGGRGSDTGNGGPGADTLTGIETTTG